MPWTLSAKLLLVFLVIAPPTRLSAQQADDCPGPAALMSPSQPAYEDAMALKKILESQGMAVRCIFETKFSSAFVVWEGGKPRSTVEGEACIRTNLGDLEVLFMWKPRTFAELSISEHRVHGGYVYDFSGMDDVWLRKFKHQGSAHRNYYFRRANYLLSAGAEELRNAVATALQYPPLSL